MDILQIRVSNINWETDGVTVNLPETVELTLDYDVDIEDGIADELSDTYGFLVNSFAYEVLNVNEGND